MKPKSRNEVIATEKGWVDSKTGEMLRRVPDLVNRIKSFFSSSVETTTKQEFLDSAENQQTDIQTDIIPTKEILQIQSESNEEPVDPLKEIHDEFQSLNAQRESVDPVVTTSVEVLVGDVTLPDLGFVDTPPPAEEPATNDVEKEHVNIETKVPKKRGRKKKTDEAKSE